MTTLHKFSNLIELLIYFNNEQKCRDYLEQIRWPNGIICPHCSHEKCFKYNNGKKYRCSECKMDFSIRTGTIFADSRITLQKWFAAIYLITSHKKGISSLQLHRDLGVTQKTAWFMLHRIRKTLKIETSEKLSGIYHNISDKHTQSYVDEFVFRFNNRNCTEDFRFDKMLNNINNHINYNQLISKNGSTRINKKMEAKQGIFGF